MCSGIRIGIPASGSVRYCWSQIRLAFPANVVFLSNFEQLSFNVGLSGQGGQCGTGNHKKMLMLELVRYWNKWTKSELECFGCRNTEAGVIGLGADAQR